MNRSVSYFLLLSTLFIAACSSNAEEPSEGIYALGRTVYNASTNSRIVYWQNGKQRAVENAPDAWPVAFAVADGQINIVWNQSDRYIDSKYIHTVYLWNEDGSTTEISGAVSSQANDAFYAEGSLYILGFEYPNETNETVPVYWKDGQRNELYVPADFHLIQAKEMTVSDGLVYATGYYRSTSGMNIPVMWQNETIQELELGDFESADATSISVENGTVYVGGSLWDVESQKQSLAIWTNGALTTIIAPEEPLQLYTNKLRVTNGNVLLAGHGYSHSEHQGFYYLNGNKVVLETEADVVNYWITQVAMADGEVYMSGRVSSTQGSESRYWINGIRQSLGGIPSDILLDLVVNE